MGGQVLVLGPVAVGEVDQIANKLKQGPDWKEDCAVEIFQPM